MSKEQILKINKGKHVYENEMLPNDDTHIGKYIGQIIENYRIFTNVR